MPTLVSGVLDAMESNTPTPLVLAAPAASAAFKKRESWCEGYVSRLIAGTPDRGSLPLDLRPTHRFETEFNSCKLNPQQYEAETLGEIEVIKKS